MNDLVRSGAQTSCASMYDFPADDKVPSTNDNSPTRFLLNDNRRNYEAWKSLKSAVMIRKQWSSGRNDAINALQDANPGTPNARIKMSDIIVYIASCIFQQAITGPAHTKHQITTLSLSTRRPTLPVETRAKSTWLLAEGDGNQR